MNVNAARTEPRQQDWSRRISWVLMHFMRWFSAHWLLMANLALAIYIGLPALAPILMDSGHERAAGLIYTVFSPLCHQLPERSFFLFGEHSVYSYEALGRALGGFVPSRYVGNADLGFKVAVCERCVSIYGIGLQAGLLFGLVRKRLKPLSIRGFLLLIAPMGIDGTGQLIGFWESTWWSRLATGALFGIACVWLLFPYLERGMKEVWDEAQRMFTREGR
jgi:uncharacterized membrane protein